MKIYSNIRAILGTIRPVDGTVGLRCSVADAEYNWHEWVSRNDRKDFELVVESAPHGCNVFVRPWSESDMLAGGAPSPLVEWVVIMVVCVAFWWMVIYYV